MPIQLKEKLLNILVHEEKLQFKYLFSDLDSQGNFTIISDSTIIGILSNIEVQMYECNHMIITPGEEFKDLILLKSGRVRTLSSKYHYLTEFGPGSFFGDYNILFQLYNDRYL